MSEKKGFFKRLVDGLSKTRKSISSGLDYVFNGFTHIDDDFYDEIEEILIMADVGVTSTNEIINRLKELVKEKEIKQPIECKQLLIQTIKDRLTNDENLYEFENKKSVIVIIGVNGVGKTTTIGKLSAQFKEAGKKVILAAADTFRAGAIEQLRTWAQRANVDLIAQSEGADPGAVIFDAINACKSRGADILICDTAGRLHNKKNLMNELGKIDRIIDKNYEGIYRENLIVVDATTGQNAIFQLKEFSEIMKIDGVILTKLDGTAKGGIVLAIQDQLKIPVKYIGVGEKINDLQKFDTNEFVDALFDMERETI